MSGLTYNHVDVHQGWDEGSRRSSIESLLSYARECEDDGKLPGIWSGDCLFVLEPDPGPDVPVESGDAISSSVERRNRFLRRRNRPRERPHINPAASTMSHQDARQPVEDRELTPSSPLSPVSSGGGSFSVHRPPTPPPHDFWAGVKPLTVRPDRRRPLSWTRHLMEDNDGRPSDRRRSPQKELRRAQQQSKVAPEVSLDKSHARGIITRTWPQSMPHIAERMTFGRRNTGVPQNGSPPLSEAMQTAPATTCAGASAQSARKAELASMAQTAPILQGYYPTGVEESTTPLGKYYPTNWEARQRKKGRMSTAIRRTGDTASPARAPPLKSLRPKGSPIGEGMLASYLPQPKPNSTLPSPVNPVIQVSRPVSTRPVSELSVVPSSQAQLLQYKRDIITQTAQKAKEVLHWAKPVGADLDENTQQQLARRITLLSVCNRPKSPKIEPTVLSPGPVTPMTLDGEGDTDYLTAKAPRHRATQLSRSGEVISHTA